MKTRADLLADLASLRSMVADYNVAAPSIGEQPITGIDLDPGPASEPIPGPRVAGWSNMRADGAVQLDGYEAAKAKFRAGNDSFLREWANDPKTKSWWFLRECMDAPGLTERQRFNIGANCGNTQSKGHMLYEASESQLEKRSATWFAFDFTPSPDGALWVQGALIPDAASFGQETPAGFQRPVAAEAEQYAAIHAEKARKSKLNGPGFGFGTKR